jgi:hypothetical protein
MDDLERQDIGYKALMITAITAGAGVQRPTVLTQEVYATNGFQSPLVTGNRPWFPTMHYTTEQVYQAAKFGTPLPGPLAPAPRAYITTKDAYIVDPKTGKFKLDPKIDNAGTMNQIFDTD